MAKRALQLPRWSENTKGLLRLTNSLDCSLLIAQEVSDEFRAVDRVREQLTQAREAAWRSLAERSPDRGQPVELRPNPHHEQVVVAKFMSDLGNAESDEPG